MNAAANARGWRAVLAAFAAPAAWTMFFLGFASGLPFLLVGVTLAYWLREGGIELRSITMIASAGLAYSFKFLWAPLVDRWQLPWLGRLGLRRGWLVLAMLALVLGLLAMAEVTPARLTLFIGLTVAVAIAGATLDIVVDAYRVEIAPTTDQGALVATYSLGYRIALIISGAVALVLADHVAWPWVYRAMAACFLVPLVACLVAREPNTPRLRSQTWAQGLHEGVVAPFLDVFKRFGRPTAWALIVFILGIKISDQALVGGIIGPFYLDQGFSKTEIAAVTKVYGIWVGIAGVFLGGAAVARWGLLWPLLIAIVLGAASNLLYLILIGANGDLMRLTVVISGENLAQGFLGTAAVAYLSALVNQRYTATQYALFSSLIMLPGKLLGFYSGIIVELGGGYAIYFVLSAVLALPAVGLFFWLKPRVRFTEPLADDRHSIQP